jgi:hypothetical protein
MVAQFLRSFSQYRLEDLVTMPAVDFLYLLHGLTDLENPTHTEPPEETLARKVAERAREAHQRAMSRAGMR